MREEIIKELKKIEKEENVKILLAVESGSRAWGFDSADSDYDVRFIYKRKEKEYLRLDKTKDVIVRPINNDLDISGWDISKTLKLLYASNPSLYEWLNSPIVYKKREPIKELKKLSKVYFSKIKILNHYYHLASTHYSKFVLDKEKVNLKKYFYILRSLASALYTIENDTVAPIEFDVLRNSQFTLEINEIIDELIKIKKENNEKKQVIKIEKLNDYIVENLTEIENYIKQLAGSEALSYKKLNEFFLKVIKD